MGCQYVSSQSYSDSATMTYSSQASTTYPASNVTNASRTKVWRSAGNWDITSSNKTFIFRETTGVDLTATLTEDTYSSMSTFLVEVKAALEATGASTYTVEQDATSKKIKITSNGSGGGGIFELRWTNASSAGFAGIAGFSTSTDDTGALTYTADSLKVHTSEWIMFDMGIATNPEFFAMTGARNTNLQLSDSAVIKLEGNATNNFSSPDFTTTLSYDQNTVIHTDSTGFHSVGLRYWRTYIEDPSNPNGYVEIGHMQFADSFRPTRGAVQFPLVIRYADLGKNQASESGVVYSRIGERTEMLALKWYGLTIGEKEEIDALWDIFGIHTPFYISLDPDGAFSSSESIYAKYVRFEKPPTVTLKTPGNFEVHMDLREEL